jgi:hypothetical protein
MNNRKLANIKTMKTHIIPVLTVLALATLPATAQQTYLGTGDSDGPSAWQDGAGITEVDINNTANNITFTIDSNDPQASWIFYAVEIQQVGLGGSGYSGFANPYGPAVGISTGVNAVLDTVGNSSGLSGNAYTFGNSSTPTSSLWIPSFVPGGTASSFSITVPLSSLGLAVGNSFYFDVVSSYTSPAGQAAYGSLDASGWLPESDNNWAPWNGTSYYDSVLGISNGNDTDFGTAASEYTVVGVPEPATCVLMGMGALAMIRRSLRRNVQ